MKKSKINKEIEYPWFRYYGDVPHHLNYPEGSMASYLKTAVEKYPEYTAIEYFSNSWTYKEFYDEIKQCARALKQLGMKKGEVVSICMPNTPQAVIMFYAINMAGGIANMIHPLSSEKEIEFYLNKSRSSIALVIDVDYKKIMRVINDTGVTKIILTSAADEMPKFKAFLYNVFKGDKTRAIKKVKEVVLKALKKREVITWKKFIENGNKYHEEIECEVLAEDPAVILYSGGTTGKPKGIVLSNKNFNSLATQCAYMCKPNKAGDSILNILPIFHGFGLGVCIHTCLTIGMRCVLIPVFSGKTLPSLIKQYQPSFIAGVPTLFEAVAKSTMFGKDGLACVHSLICGGDMPTEQTRIKVNKFFKEHGSSAEIRVGYGLTESSAATSLTPRDGFRKGSIGVPLPDVVYKIVKIGTHDEVPFGEDGEICISGPTVMLGYLDEISETMQVLREHEDGRIWLHTGDIGMMDEDGYVYFKSRLKRVIVTSGYNVYPSYLEEKINMHKDVLTSTVIGVDDKYRGQKVKAFIVLKEGVELTDDVKKSIEEHCEKYIAKYAMPKEIEYKKELPKTLVGKIAYSKLVEEEKKKK